MSTLVGSIREVQKMQAQVRSQLGALEAKERQAPAVQTGLPTGKCAGWVQTTGCLADGTVYRPGGKADTKSCTTPLSDDWSGYCNCGDPSNPIKIGFDCRAGQQGRTCAEVCQQTGASAYGPLPAADLAACIGGGGVWMGDGGQGFASGNPTAFFPGCADGSKCCAPLTGTINVADTDKVFVTGASGSLSYMNGAYTLKNGYTGGNAQTVESSATFVKDPSGPVMVELSAYDGDAWTIQGTRVSSGAGVSYVNATGPYAKDPHRIPVGGPAEPWQSNTGESADASGIRLSATSKADATQDSAQKTALTSKLQELEEIESSLLDDLRTHRLAASGEASATSLALRAEGKASTMIQAESEEQRRRLARQRGQLATDTTMITAARSTSLRAQAYTRVTIVAIVVLIAVYIIYRLRKAGMFGGNVAFILSVAVGGAALIVISIMLNHIKSRNPRNFALLYFSPPAGPSSGVQTSSPTSDNGNDLQGCRRALRAARDV
jgi:hypothetical protein